ncbi:hypothetical protein L0Y59_05210 [Candidatus Uhrbacteria bacterium]|nr:hypothetical protein [Candidatus Uhrbacteria bacterium]
MRFFTWLDERTKRMDWIDMALTKVSCMAFGLLLAVFLPQLVGIHVGWLVAIWLIFAFRPLYRFFK